MGKGSRRVSFVRRLSLFLEGSLSSQCVMVGCVQGSSLRLLYIRRDRKRKKFVGDSGQDAPGKKRIKTESGHWIRASYKSNAYKEWKEKHKINTPFGGQEEEEEGEGVRGEGSNAQRFRTMIRGHRQFRHKQNSQDQHGKGKMGGGRGKGKGGTVADLKPKAAILKKRQKKEFLERKKNTKGNQKLKNRNSRGNKNTNTSRFQAKRRTKK